MYRWTEAQSKVVVIYFICGASVLFCPQCSSLCIPFSFTLHYFHTLSFCHLHPSSLTVYSYQHTHIFLCNNYHISFSFLLFHSLILCSSLPPFPLSFFLHPSSSYHTISLIFPSTKNVHVLFSFLFFHSLIQCSCPLLLTLRH